MFIRNLTLQNFKNHPFQEFYFSSQINCFVGNNGVGKTRILKTLSSIASLKKISSSVLELLEKNNLEYIKINDEVINVM